MIDAATEFRKNGFNDQDAAQLAKISSIFQNVSDEAISAGDSASFLISQMIAFGDDSPEYAMHIIDSVNAVANNFSVSSGQMAQGLGIVASTSSAMGNSMEETLGLMTAITEQTRSVSKSARGLNSIMSSLVQVLDDGSENGKKISAVFDSINESMYDSNGTIKSGFDLLQILSNHWEELGTNQQLAVAELIAVKNQINNFMALMNNFDHAVEATNTAMESQGSAIEENKRYMGGLNKMGPLKRI